MSQNDSQHMFRAIDLARRAEGWTSPNPMVGCVLVRNDEVVGEGWHKGPGQAHAEAMALSVAGEAAKGATAYVTLEPCNHFGRTPPCADGLIKAGVARVVFAVADPNPQAAGGAKALRDAGLAVERMEGTPAATAEELIRPWIFSLSSDRPYVYAKWASSLDGRVATRGGQSKWITGAEARAKSHELRARTDAILVGVGTILADDPSLDARLEGRETAPALKVVLDSSGRTPLRSKLLTSPGPVLIIVSGEAHGDRLDALRGVGAEVLVAPTVHQKPDIGWVLRLLKERGLVSVMIEGGPIVLGAAIDAGVVDEVWTFLAPKILGAGTSAVLGRGAERLDDSLQLENMTINTLGTDVLIRSRVAQGQKGESE